MSGVRVNGLRETVRSLERMGVEVQDLKAAFKRIGSFITDDARSLAPVRSGRLAASIRPSNTKNKSIIRAGGAKVPYAGVIHYGWPTRNIEPQPFMEEAIAKNEEKVKDMMEDELKRLIRSLNLK